MDQFIEVDDDIKTVIVNADLKDEIFSHMSYSKKSVDKLLDECHKFYTQSHNKEGFGLVIKSE